MIDWQKVVDPNFPPFEYLFLYRCRCGTSHSPVVLRAVMQCMGGRRQCLFAAAAAVAGSVSVSVSQLLCPTVCDNDNDNSNTCNGGDVGGGGFKHNPTVTEYYNCWSGHIKADLRVVHDVLRQCDDSAGGDAAPRRRPLVWLAGDSTMDNKAWVLDGHDGKPTAAAVRGYDRVLEPPLMARDVCYFVNTELAARGLDHACINAAMEETKLGDRRRGRHLLPADEVVRDSIGEEDVLVVCVGGNDVALAPSVPVAVALAVLAWLTPRQSLEEGRPAALWPLLRVFRNDTQAYIDALVSRVRPKAVVVCMVYFPAEEKPDESWANLPLALLGYNSDPAQLQAAIKRLFALGTSAVRVDGGKCVTVPVPLYEALDGRTPGDYVARVEPSEQGGEKLARMIVAAVDKGLRLAAK